MATVTHDARECACGHQFDHDDADASLTSEEIRLKAEELYENYLRARVEQARKAVLTAQGDFARDPSSSDKSDRVASAIREVQTAESTLATQSARVAEMKKTMLPAAQPAAPIPVAAPARKRVTALKAAATKPQTRITRKPIPVLTEVVAAAPAPMRPKRQAKVAAAAPKKSPVVVVAPTKPEVAPQPAQSATPNPAFRQAQAAKAEKILQAISSIKPAPAPAPAKVIKEEPRMPAVTTPKPAQATSIPVKAAPRLYTPRDKRECPNCTASVAISAARCRCGYEFPSSGHLIPPLAMSDEERAEFAKLFNFP